MQLTQDVPLLRKEYKIIMQIGHGHDPKSKSAN